MRWRFWERGDHDNKSASSAGNETVDAGLEKLRRLKDDIGSNDDKTRTFTAGETVAISLLTLGSAFAAQRLYKRYLRRIPNVDHLKPGDLRNRSLYGYVTSVGDGDNFRLFHTPGGLLTGWRWLPGRGVPTEKKALQDRTIHVRIAGVDAPEAAHFGRPAQPYSQEALDWLRDRVLHRSVRAFPFRRDQYDRVVCSVFRRKWLFFRSDIGLEMLRGGYATVYEAKFGSEFAGQEEKYRQAEDHARKGKVGMWKKPGIVDKMLGRNGSIETPREYKQRMKGEDMTR